MRNRHSNKYSIVVFSAFFVLITLVGFSAADSREPSLTAVENAGSYAMYMPVVATRLELFLDGVLRESDVCADCCSLITLKNRGLVYELVPDESYTRDLATYDDFWVIVRGMNDGFCSTNGRPIFRVFDIWPVPPPIKD